MAEDAVERPEAGAEGHKGAGRGQQGVEHRHPGLVDPVGVGQALQRAAARGGQGDGGERH